MSSVARTVSDYELLLHDIRKLKDVLNYYNNNDEHSLRAMFIDKVDIHTGERISMVTMAGRWPTIISDFQQMNKKDIDTNKVKEKMSVSKAEAVVLVTKNKLYINWSKMFLETAKQRYKSVKSLIISMEKTIDEYRGWLKPYITRFKMIEQGLSRENIRGDVFTSFCPSGQSVSNNNIVLWAWGKLLIEEKGVVPTKIRDNKFAFDIDPYDHPSNNYIKENFIYDKKNGLINQFKWLTKEKIDKTASNLKKELVSNGYLDPTGLYYVFLEFNINRTVMRTPGSNEIEDIEFNISACSMSQNILFVKMLELEFKKKELEIYIDEILGLKKSGIDIDELMKIEYPEIYGGEKKKKKNVTINLNNLKSNLLNPVPTFPVYFN